MTPVVTHVLKIKPLLSLLWFSYGNAAGSWSWPPTSI